MKRQKLITWLIAGLVLLVIGFYAVMMLWGARIGNDAPPLIRLAFLAVILIVLLPLMAMMIVTAIRRNREIEKENEDDLGKY